MFALNPNFVWSCVTQSTVLTDSLLAGLLQILLSNFWSFEQFCVNGYGSKLQQRVFHIAANNCKLISELSNLHENLFWVSILLHLTKSAVDMHWSYHLIDAHE